MCHRFALCLLGEESLAFTQCFFRMRSLGEITCDSLNTNRLAVPENQPRTYFQSDAATAFCENVDFINCRYLLARLSCDHVARKTQMLPRNYISDVHRRDFGARVAGNSFSSSIERREVSLKIVRVDDVVRVLKELAISFFSF